MSAWNLFNTQTTKLITEVFIYQNVVNPTFGIISASHHVKPFKFDQVFFPKSHLDLI